MGEGEDLASALRRERREELGLDVRVGAHLATVLFGRESHQEYLRCTVTGGTFGSGTGPEYGPQPPGRGSYRPVRVAVGDLPVIDVRPRCFPKP